MTDDNRDKFNYIAGQYNQTIKFYNVEELCKDRVADLKKYIPAGYEQKKIRFGLGTFWRLFLPYVLPKEIKKIIYLDSDTIINLDIAELWKIDIEEHILGVVPEAEWNSGRSIPARNGGRVDENRYFNAGILMINMEKFRQAETIMNEGMIFFKENPKYANDQELLNYCFSEDTLLLPVKFNVEVIWSRGIRDYDTSDKIVHYLAWALGMYGGDVWNKLFFQYFIKTPWCNEDIFANIHQSVVYIYNEQRDNALRIANLLAKKQRILCSDQKNLSNTKNHFEVEETEKILVIDDDVSKAIEGLFLSMSCERDAKVHIILTNNYDKLKVALIKKGFDEWQNFIDGKLLLSLKNGGRPSTPFYSWFMVRDF